MDYISQISCSFNLNLNLCCTLADRMIVILSCIVIQILELKHKFFFLDCEGTIFKSISVGNGRTGKWFSARGVKGEEDQDNGYM